MNRAAWVAGVLTGAGAGVCVFMVVRRLDSLREHVVLQDFEGTINQVGDQLDQIRSAIPGVSMMSRDRH